MKAAVIALLFMLLSSGAIAQKNVHMRTFGEWRVLRTVDGMDDKPTCFAVYGGAEGVQLSGEAVYISLRGRGGLSAYRFRWDDDPASSLNLATDFEKRSSIIQIGNGVHVMPDRLRAAKRLRAQVSTLVSGIRDYDIDLSAGAEIMDFLGSQDCLKGSPGQTGPWQRQSSPPRSGAPADPPDLPTGQVTRSYG